MKTFITCLLLVIGLFGYSQIQTTSHWTAVKTIVYEKYNEYSDWRTVETNRDVEIPVAMTENVVQINAKLATSVKVYPSTKVEWSDYTKGGTKYSATAYDGYDITKNQNCLVTLFMYSNQPYLVLDITYGSSHKFSIQYFLTKDN